jgi:hypothetical protein
MSVSLATRLSPPSHKPLTWNLIPLKLLAEFGKSLETAELNCRTVVFSPHLASEANVGPPFGIVFEEGLRNHNSASKLIIHSVSKDLNVRSGDEALQGRELGLELISTWIGID